MSKMMLAALLLSAMTLNAAPIPMLRHRLAPPPHRAPHYMSAPRAYHHRSLSPSFAVGFGAGLIANAVVNAAVRPTYVPPPPVVARNPVWVPPVYETRPVLDVFGNIIRYETVLVRVGYWAY